MNRPIPSTAIAMPTTIPQPREREPQKPLEVVEATDLTSLNAASSATPELPSQIANFLTNFDSLFCKRDTLTIREGQGKGDHDVHSVVFCDSESGSNPINVKLRIPADHPGADAFNPRFDLEEIKVGNSPWVKTSPIDGYNDTLKKLAYILYKINQL